ncbi:hypothetical protein [Paenibacillus sp. YPG26]|uniref:hypothetical protein n=1 Tax=Paenibacillus sp. YPG26 TaxID=2878915 RepID=UPI00203EB58B|nr:hypothetical protein [Paenibacillus sp. YPG26]USB34115.1 hypothetical protein LDO05_04685 [Paenibacillus sp. YPG26]
MLIEVEKTLLNINWKAKKISEPTMMCIAWDEKAMKFNVNIEYKMPPIKPNTEYETMVVSNLRYLLSLFLFMSNPSTRMDSGTIKKRKIVKLISSPIVNL